MKNMNKKNVCKVGCCTACGSCVNVCPQQCISFESNMHMTSSAIIDLNKCIDCKLCRNACPQINKVDGNLSVECYAGWSADNKIRETSASGGVASTLYSYFLGQGAAVAGVSLDSKFNAKYLLTTEETRISTFRNSKYIFSEMGGIYKEIESRLKNNESVLFIGLPCQVAGVYRFLDAKGTSKLLLSTVDIVCHGTCSASFFKEHVSYLERKTGKTFLFANFRDPNFGTHTFTLSFGDEKCVYYKKLPRSNDAYQVGYHEGVIYRDNCYRCEYARKNRVGDLTIADFSCVGKIEPVNFTNRNVSCVLINTSKGKQIIHQMSELHLIELNKRPLQEAWNFEKQLNHPTPESKMHTIFINSYEESKNFELAMRKACSKLYRKYTIKSVLHVEQIRGGLSSKCPDKLKQLLKCIVGKNKK